jgi:hypothetical protein
MELKSQDQKIMNYMRSIRKLTRFRNDNLTLLEQKIQCYKKKPTQKSRQSISDKILIQKRSSTYQLAIT